MTRRVLWVALLIGITVVVAYLLLTIWYAVTGPPADAWGTALSRLFNFMDVGLGVWLILLIVLAARRVFRGSLVLLAAVTGAVLNMLVVIVIGFIQIGSAPWDFVGYAATSGIAVLLGALVATPIAQRIARPE